MLYTCIKMTYPDNWNYEHCKAYDANLKNQQKEQC